MKLPSRSIIVGLSAILLAAVCGRCMAAEETSTGTRAISGIYPHLAVFSEAGEIGMGAVVPWAGKLWLITYPPHEPKGSPDKLYEIDPDMTRHIRPESVGGTHAGRMFHEESKQLIIGPYFIDEKGNVRAADVKKLVGRLTAVARHLTDPANKVYFYDMEGALYEVTVHSLEVTRLFAKPVPGWHGKGAYTSQGRLVVANNGERTAGKTPKFEAKLPPKTDEDAGVLAEWDGKEWRILERHQFTEVTGPGGLHGAPDDKSPLWSIGWDRRSVILKLLDGGQWYTFRLPKASHCYDPKHGFYTEWPRIREIGSGKWMMDMHGMFYDFPSTFRIGQTGGLKPIASHLRMVPDFCEFNGRLVLASDDASIMQNPMAGTSQSNMWFGKVSDLPTFGPRNAWGGPWVNDPVKAGQPSVPFLFSGFDARVLHLAHDAADAVNFKIELDAKGDGNWQTYQTIAVGAHGYQCHLFPADTAAAWARVTVDKDCTATAYFHMTGRRDASRDNDADFASIAKITDTAPISGGIIRPAKHNHSLQFVSRKVGADGAAAPAGYFEVDGEMRFEAPAGDRSEEVNKIAEIKPQFHVDEASVIVTNGTHRYRLPKSNERYDKPFATGWPRAIRECITERNLMNVHGTFYEMPRENGLEQLKPVCTHNRQIVDFCTWRGLLVISGNTLSAKPDEHYFSAGDNQPGLWFGSIDDLWRMGKPVGKGGPWLNAAVQPDAPSDPYLMTGYDVKRLALSHNAAKEVQFTIEVNVDHSTQWHVYKTITVPAGQTVTETFPAGFSAHWARLKVNQACSATGMFTYE